MPAIAPSLSNPFVRTRYTWLSYTLLACFGFGLSLVGPIMPFLAAKCISLLHRSVFTSH